MKLGILAGVLLGFCLSTCGCATLGFPSSEKNLSTRQIPKRELEAVKEVIMNNGYMRISKDNYPYRGALVTQYEKQVSSKGQHRDEHDGKVRIMMSFRFGPESEIYHNVGIWIVSLSRVNITEINAEVDRITEILYEKLLRASGRENVVREDHQEGRP